MTASEMGYLEYCFHITVYVGLCEAFRLLFGDAGHYILEAITIVIF